MPVIDKQEQLAQRFARLSSSSGDHGDRTALQGRLEALSGGRSPPEGVEEDLNSRLASLAAERENTSSSAEDLNIRLSRLAGKPATAAPPTGKQQYVVPEDWSDDEWNDLDDLLEDAVGEAALGAIAVDRDASSMAEFNVDDKLGEIEVLLAAEAARASRGGSAVADRAEIGVDQAVEVFLGGAATLGSGDSKGDGLGEEEQCLVNMVSDQLRLEGHGLVATPLQEQPGEIWLPFTPTGRPEVSPAAAASKTRHQTASSTNLDARANARLVAQQAMDKARLDVGNATLAEKGGTEDGGRKSSRPWRRRR